MKKLLLSLFFLSVFAVGSFSFYWLSSDQKLKRSCEALIIEKLVSPSTAKTIAFSIVESPDDSIIRQKLISSLNDAQNILKQKKETVSEFERLINEISLKEPSEGMNELKFLQDKLSLFERAAQGKAEATKEASAAEEKYNEINNLVENHKQAARSEAVISLDAQNRSGALIRMYGICSFSSSEVSIGEKVSSMKFEIVEEGSVSIPLNSSYF